VSNSLLAVLPELRDAIQARIQPVTFTLPGVNNRQRVRYIRTRSTTYKQAKRRMRRLGFRR
jgi:hypothetical protein